MTPRKKEKKQKSDKDGTRMGHMTEPKRQKGAKTLQSVAAFLSKDE